jgi:hypothetical protein
VLARVRAFLPELAASNAALADAVVHDPASVDIERVPRGAAHVRMNLALGVFEARSDGEGEPAEDDGRELSEDDSSLSEADSEDAATKDSASSGDSDSQEDSSDSEGSEPNVLDLLAPPSRIRRPMKPLPKRVRPSIVMLDTPEKAGSASAPPA